MAIIGTLGKVIFSVSKKKVNTFNGMKWSSSAKYATHERHLKDTLLEFTGTDPDKIDFSMSFSVFLGVNPIAEITKLLNAERSGQAMRLVIGPKAYGKDKWVIKGIQTDLERFDNSGNLLAAKVSVSLEAYVRR